MACAVLLSSALHNNKETTTGHQMTSTGIQVPPSSRVVFAKDHRSPTIPHAHAAHLTSAVSTSPYQHTSFCLSISAPTKRNGAGPGWSVAASPAASHAKKTQAKKVLPGTRSNWPLREAGRCRGTHLGLHNSCIIWTCAAHASRSRSIL